MPVVLSAPQHLVFSHWAAGQGTDTYCIVTTRVADVSWDPVPGATAYQVWQSNSNTGDHLMIETTDTSATGLTFDFGRDWGIQTSIQVVALDGAGNSATTSVDGKSQIPVTDWVTIAARSPAEGAEGVAANAPLSLTFSAVLDPTSVSSQTIGLIRQFPGGWGPASSTVLLESDHKTVDVMPIDALVPGEWYNFVVDCALKDTYGNHAIKYLPGQYFPSGSFMIATSS